MNYVTRMCFLISYLSISNYAVPPEQLQPQTIYKALVFSSSTREIYNTRSFSQITATTYNRWVHACAADSVPEENFAKITPLEGKILFVHNIVEQGFVTIGDTCKNPFQISAAYHSSAKELQFGYEVYYDKERYGGFDLSDDKFIRSIKQYTSSAWKTVMQQLQFGSLTLDDEQKTKFEFLWVTRISLQHDIAYWSPSIIRYQLLRNFPGKLQECEDYHLAEEYFQSVDLGSFYDKENQKSILQGIDTSSFTSELECDHENDQCLMKWQLVPPNQINYDSLGPNTCSNLTTVPIWTDLTRGPLENLQIFLQAIVRALRKNLDIIVVLGEPLALSKSNEKPSNPIYLDSKNNRIPIPNAIYHLIKYEVPNCNIPGTICHHAVIIVIHNDPNFVQIDRACPQETDLCQKLGWSWIQNEDIDQKAKYENIYCCEPSNPLLEKFETSSENQSLKFNPLNLGEFPFYDKSIGNINSKNLSDEIQTEIRKMMERNGDDSSHGSSSFKSENDEVEETQFAENDKSTRKL